MKYRTGILIGALLFLYVNLNAQLIQHLDAEASGSVVFDANNVVSEWLDQSGAGNNALTRKDSIFYSVGTGDEMSWLDFRDTACYMQLFSPEESDTWLDQSSGTGGFCVIMAFKLDGIVDNWSDMFGNSTVVSQGFGLRFSSGGSIQAYLGGNTLNKGGYDLEIGDKVVYAFNYNASTNTYEFWDSKNGSSITGTITHADFSLDAPVSIGSITGDSRYFDGWIGEVKVMNMPLDASTFKDESEEMAVKWADYHIPMELSWRAIPEDVRFPTEDVILAAISVDDVGFENPLPADPSNEDCTNTFQEAIDLVGASGGGTVFIPEGHYRLDGRLNMPSNVTLRGRWRALSETDPEIGTVLKVYDGRGNPEGSPFLTVAGSGGVRDLTFWHPEQIPDNIVAYPFVIASNGGPITIENITLINAYQGVNMSSASMCFIDNIQGTALNTGFFADKSYAVSRFDKLVFGPDFWQWSGLQGDVSAAGDYESYIRNNGLGIDIREMDGFHLTECRVWGMNIGLQFDVGVTGDNPHGDISGLDFRDCNVGLRINSAKGLKIVNSYLEGSVAGLQNLYTGNLGIKANNCTFVSDGLSFQNYAGADLSIGSCVFDGLVSTAGKVKIVGCEFINTGADLEFRSNISSALIYGSSFADGMDLTDYSTSTAQITIKNDVTDDRYSPAPLLPPKDLSIVRKPAKYDLFDITDYGAVANDGIDDSDAFSQAVAAANANAGGIVFVPYGIFNVSGSYTLISGVELRGISGSRHKSNAGDLHSMLQITGGEGDPEGDAFITLSANSGVRGLTFYYPSQHADMIVPETLFEYPFTIRGTGYGVWVTDCNLSNPYQGVNFVYADDHLLENCFLGGLNKTIYVQNCDGGRVENFHLKPDFWRDLKMANCPTTGTGPTGTSALKRYCGKYLHGIWLENTTNQVVFNIFNHASHQFFRADNSTGIGFMIGGEQLQRAYRFSGNSDISLVLPIGNINNQGDRSGSFGIWGDENFTGTANLWVGGTEGCADKAYFIEAGEVITQQSSIGGSGGRGVVGLEVKSAGTLEHNAFTFSRVISTVFEEGADVSIRESLIGNMPNSFFTDEIVTLERNIFEKSYVVTDENQNWFWHQGLVLDEEGITLEDANMFSTDPYDARRISGARSSTNEYLIRVEDKDFLLGSNNPLDITSYFYIDSDCTIEVYYNSTSGRKLGKSYSFAGAAEPAYKNVNFTATDARFNGTEDIYIKIKGDSPLLNFVSVSRDITSFNLAPVWAEDTLTFEAKADSLFSDTIVIGTDVSDPDGDPVTLSKVNGPSWLNVDQAGSLSGTPATTDEGLNHFIIQANDGKGNELNTIIQINVEVVAVVNLEPEWSADTILLRNAMADSVYNDTIEIGVDITDPENDELVFTKISGSDWVNVSAEGILSGIPGEADEGDNYFEIQADDGNGNLVRVVLMINVELVSDISKSKFAELSIYPVPANDVLRLDGTEGKVEYEIYSLSGCKILEGITTDNTIHIGNLISGSYILRIEERVFNVIKN
jgi:hypothetical protein